MLHSFVLSLGGRGQTTCKRCLRMLAHRAAAPAEEGRE
jgi:hypothetical protein